MASSAADKEVAQHERYVARLKTKLGCQSAQFALHKQRCSANYRVNSWKEFCFFQKFHITTKAMRMLASMGFNPEVGYVYVALPAAFGR